jgi:hypothetical protein
MVRVNGVWNQAKNAQEKEENMNARKVVCVLCVLVVGLVLLPGVALAGPPEVYRLGGLWFYNGGYVVAPKVTVRQYYLEDCTWPTWYRGNVDPRPLVTNQLPPWLTPPDNNVAPLVPVPRYYQYGQAPWAR